MSAERGSACACSRASRAASESLAASRTRPSAWRARPDLCGDAHPIQAEVRIVTADIEPLVEHAQRVVEAARGDVDVSEIGANECAEADISHLVGESYGLRPDLCSLGELA